METKLVIISLEDLKKNNCSDSLQILDKEFDLTPNPIIDQIAEKTHNLFTNKHIYISPQGKITKTCHFISYEEFNKKINCEDNKKITDDFIDINPIVPPLTHRTPVSLSYILKKSRKKRI